jgi:Fe-S cluster biogenesis protein NfuA
MFMIKDEVEKALDEVRPMLIKDGGNVELVGVNDEGVVLVKLRGA